MLTVKSSILSITFIDVTLGILHGSSWITAQNRKTVMVPQNHIAEVHLSDVQVLLGNEGPLQSQTLMF